MARLPYEGRVKVWFTTTLTSESSPSLAEFTGGSGTDLTTFITKDGVNPGTTNNRIDTAGIDSAFDSQELIDELRPARDLRAVGLDRAQRLELRWIVEV